MTENDPQIETILQNAGRRQCVIDSNLIHMKFVPFVLETPAIRLLNYDASEQLA